MAQNAQQNDDVNEWVVRLKDVAANPQIVTAPAPQTAAPWHNRLLAFFEPIDTTLITCCCPCVTFGKTHHRLRKDPNLVGYSAVNPSCLGWWGAACFGLHVIPNLMQRADIRAKYNLQGDIMTDCLRAWCCNCCDLIQQDKEAAYHAVNQSEMVADQPPKNIEQMNYQQQA